eukprot:UN21161
MNLCLVSSRNIPHTRRNCMLIKLCSLRNIKWIT